MNDISTEYNTQLINDLRREREELVKTLLNLHGVPHHCPCYRCYEAYRAAHLLLQQRGLI